MVQTLEKLRLEQREQRELLEKSMRDPAEEFKKALIEMRDDIGKDKTYSFIKEAMEALIGTPTFKKAVTKKALKK